MKVKIIKFFIIFLLSGTTQIGNAQLSEDASISILTCRQGDDIYNTFGHTSIWVNDPTYNINELYNYGGFNFKEPGFLPKFLRGKLLYFLFRSDYQRFLDNYIEEKRSVFEQKLNLNTEQRNSLHDALLTNYRKENRRYLYDFFFDNCSTRPRDILESTIEGLTYPSPDREVTHRQLLDEYTFAKPWTDFGIDLIIGSKADKKTTLREQMFLPEYLFKNLESATVNGAPLVEKTMTMLDFEKEAKERQKKPWFSPMLFFGLLFLLELFILWKRKTQSVNNIIKGYDRFWFLLLGVSSLVIFFMWFGTDHIATKNNFNILWMSPLFLFPRLRKSKIGNMILMGTLALALVANILFQQMHVASITIIAITLVKLVGNYLFSRIPDSKTKHT